MTKLSLLIELLKCKICKSILDDPVLIPCGESVCACHITTGEFLKSRHSDVCLICEQIHQAPIEGYSKNRTLDLVIDIIIEINDEEVIKEKSYSNFPKPFLIENAAQKTLNSSKTVSQNKQNTIAICGLTFSQIAQKRKIVYTSSSSSIPELIPMKKTITVPLPNQNANPQKLGYNTILSANNPIIRKKVMVVRSLIMIILIKLYII